RRRADPERPAARRHRDRARRPDGDDLRPVRPAAVAREDRGIARERAARRDRRVRKPVLQRLNERDRRNSGVALQTNPPAARVIELARRAETYGFSHMWAFDSHLLWEEPFVIFSRILDATHK